MRADSLTTMGMRLVDDHGCILPIGDVYDGGDGQTVIIYGGCAADPGRHIWTTDDATDVPIVAGYVDGTTTMTSGVFGDTLVIAYPRPEWHGTRGDAARMARQYGRDRRKRASFVDVTDIGDVKIYRYRLTDPGARLRAQLSESIHNR